VRASPILCSLPTKTGFDFGHAFCLARAAELAYLAPEWISRETQGVWGAEHFDFFDLQDTQAFAAADDRFLVVSFRGTEPRSLQDWITDASTELISGPLGGKVHAGFYDALANVWQLLDRYVRHLQSQRPRMLLVTGHSLGGALAALAVGRWLNAGLPVHGLYTFGQPRTGDNTFARHFNFAFKPYTFRFVNNNDLVTRVPPRSFGYSHLGTFKYFTEDGAFAQEIDWWTRFLDQWRGRIEDVFSSGDDSIKDHSMREYCDLVGTAYRSLSPFDGRLGINRFLDSFLDDTPTSQTELQRAA
jgi:triacylglycerol lipase